MPRERPRTGKLIELYNKNIIDKVELLSDNAASSSNSPDAKTSG